MGARNTTGMCFRIVSLSVMTSCGDSLKRRRQCTTLSSSTYRDISSDRLRDGRMVLECPQQPAQTWKLRDEGVGA